jgi:hypothetical protein
MKLVFLDFDGVLNSWDFLYGSREPFSSTSADEKIDPEAVRRLNEITDRTGASIVVSSAWRIGKKVADLRELLHRHGVTGQVVGATPRNDRTRGDQIAESLEYHKRLGREVDSFVILDDDNDMGGLTWALVKTTMAQGLQDEHVAQAVEILEEAP